MNVHVVEPPPAQRAGGLEIGLRSLEAFLCRSGVTVRRNPSLEELGASKTPVVAHFHGLWQRKFLKSSAFCRRLNVPYVVSPHGMLEPWAFRHKRWKKLLWYQLFEKLHLSRASSLLTTSEAESRNLKKLLPSANCAVLPLGLTADCRPGFAEARRKLGWPESEFVLLFLSRIHPKKGLDVLLRALAGLGGSDVRNVRLVVVGGGEPQYVRMLRSYAERESSRLPRVDWQGEIWDDKKWAYFQGADLFCLPSHSENFGLAILEALQVGTRVLTTDRTPWEEVSSWGAGIVVPPFEEEVRSGLAGLLKNRDWTNDQRARLASRIHEQFSWSTVGPAYLRFYEGIVQNSSHES